MKSSRQLDQIVADIRAVQRACLREWHGNRASWGVMGAAEALRHVDMTALRICIDYLLEQAEAPAGISRGVAAAERLRGVLATVEQYQSEIDTRLAA